MTPSSPTCDHFPPPVAPGFTPSRGDRSRPGVVRVHRVRRLSPSESRQHRGDLQRPAHARHGTRFGQCHDGHLLSRYERLVDFPTAASVADGQSGGTPPLWGYRDSGLYLDDGRAENLADAVKFHKGQARDSAARFARLSSRQRAEIEEFLNSLAAPPSADPEPGAGPGNRHPCLALVKTPTTGKTSQPVRRVAKTRSGQERHAASRLKLAESLEKMNEPEGALVFYREIVRMNPARPRPGSPPRESRLLPAVMRTERMSKSAPDRVRHGHFRFLGAGSLFNQPGEIDSLPATTI